MSIAQALHRLRPGAEWVVRGDEIEWMDSEQTKPTKQEIQDEIAYLESDAYKAEQEKKMIEMKRAKAYRQESDPLFFKFQRGEATEQEWLDKIAEIKTRFPDEQ